ncbi:MAG: hypothetical protein WAT67_05780 [Candidatus Contendobacter sp.]
MSETKAPNLASTYVRLRGNATAENMPVDDSFWPRLMSGELGTFHNEYLVSCHTFEADWPMWEMHPNGDEIVCLLSGAATFVLEFAAGHESITLTEPASYAFVPKGTWHTARTQTKAQMLFITAGEGTEHRQI